MDEATGIWAEAIDRLKEKIGASSYADLARELEISPQKLADARKGRRELASDVKARILVMLDEPVSDAIYEAVFPTKTRGEVIGVFDKVYDPDEDKKVSKDFWIRRLNQLSAMLEGVPDSTIAANLGISQSMISATRSGKGVLSPGAKLKILDSLGYMAGRDLLCDLLPPQAAKRLKRYENLRFVARADRRKKY